MIAHAKTIVNKRPGDKKIDIEREFAAPRAKVWAAWTQPALLDQWWAPKPWKTNTKSMDFREGGRWLYTMNGPEGEVHWCKVEYKSITPQKSFSGTDGFCNEQGKTDHNFPEMFWKVSFHDAGKKTKVEVEITFDSEEDMKKIVEMGFEEGFTMAHGNLDELLANE